MGINERIYDLINELADSENSFAKRIDVSSSVIFNIVNVKGRKSYPSGPVLEKILAIKKGEMVISAEWLMRGNGEMFILDSDRRIANSPNFSNSIEELTISVRKLQMEFNRFLKTSIK